jgi:hypothetical protein
VVFSLKSEAICRCIKQCGSLRDTTNQPIMIDEILLAIKKPPFLWEINLPVVVPFPEFTL